MIDQDDLNPQQQMRMMQLREQFAEGEISIQEMRDGVKAIIEEAEKESNQFDATVHMKVALLALDRPDLVDLLTHVHFQFFEFGDVPGLGIGVAFRRNDKGEHIDHHQDPTIQKALNAVLVGLGLKVDDNGVGEVVHSTIAPDHTVTLEEAIELVRQEIGDDIEQFKKEHDAPSKSDAAVQEFRSKLDEVLGEDAPESEWKRWGL